MNLLVALIILIILVVGDSFLPWYVDAIAAVSAAIYFAVTAIKEKKNSEWIWALGALTVAIGLAVINL